MTHPFVIVDQRILSAHVDFGPKEEHEPVWRLSYSAKDEADEFRYLEAWLHGCSTELVFSITVGALLEETGIPFAESDVEEILGGTYVSSTLFSMARKSANALLSLMEEDLALPDFLEFQSISLLSEDEDSESEEDSERPAITP